MKKMIFALMAFAIIASVSAQEKVKQQELGIGFNSLNKFAVIYKFGHQKSMWRLMSLYGNLNFNGTKYDDDLNFGQTSSAFGFKFGKQFHSKVNEEFKIIYGADFSFSYSFHNNDENNGTSISYAFTPGLNALLGFNYELNKKFVIGLELLPGFNYYFGKNKTEYEDDSSNNIERNTKGFYIGGDSSSVFLTLAYRFGKKSE